MDNEFNKVKNIFKKNLLQREELYSQDDLAEIKSRSKTISDILLNYKEQQNNRNIYKETVKKWFVPVFCAIAVLFVVLTTICVILSFIYLKDELVVLLTSLISSLLVGFTSVISILVIITKYIFPTDEEKNFNHLISIIVKNDTKRLNHIYNDHKNIDRNEDNSKDE